jgi:ribonuclease J
MSEPDQDFVFVPLGGVGEIGMNCALYGFGPPRKRKWIVVDLGVSFGSAETPGVDLIMADLSFVEKIRKDVAAIFVTHAHEDHIGAVADLWPRIGAPVYMTRFAMHVAEARRLAEPGAPDVPLKLARYGERIEAGPFSVEYVPVAHSIPEGSGLLIRTPLGMAFHTGDWKLDPDPVVGATTDPARMAAIGEEGCLALICDSTNVLREGESPSEADIAKTLRELIASAPRRVVVTTFASNVARLRTVAVAAQACGRKVVCLGRAMDRIVEAARECGYLDGVEDFLSNDMLDRLPKDKIVALATGSQGEPRAAMARIAADEHPDMKIAAGDRVIFSSRTIPGNEKAVNRIINALVDQEVEVITDRTHLVHVSGHPRRGEVARMYQWTRPQIAIPAHGEALHLVEHRALALASGVASAPRVRNGDVVRLAPERPALLDQVQSGRWMKDGMTLARDDAAMRERMKLAFAGVVSVAAVVNARGDLVGVPDVVSHGLPERGREGKVLADVIDRAVFSVLEHGPKAKRRDPDALSTLLERAVRGAVQEAWGKKPVVHALVVVA